MRLILNQILGNLWNALLMISRSDHWSALRSRITHHAPHTTHQAFFSQKQTVIFKFLIEYWKNTDIKAVFQNVHLLFSFPRCFFPIIFFIKEMPRYIAEAIISAPTVENIVDSVSLKTEICY